ncbi:MAG: 5-formyltetrahydrofolate cyclo-ligase [Methanobacterium sp.]
MKNKKILRKKVWDDLTNNNLIIPPKSAYGRIPIFKGSTEAAELIITTNEYLESNIIFSSPDSAQIKVREYALKDKKTLIMATPKLKNGYILIKPENVTGVEEYASTIEGAFKAGELIDSFPKVDMVVEGSVAVDLHGNRLGKGGGYGDMEISHLFQENVISDKTPIVTTVHKIQILDEIPAEEHDKQINMIVTPKNIIRI